MASMFMIEIAAIARYVVNMVLPSEPGDGSKKGNNQIPGTAGPASILHFRPIPNTLRKKLDKII
jgi:hypothetical protein